MVNFHYCRHCIYFLEFAIKKYIYRRLPCELFLICVVFGSHVMPVVVVTVVVLTVAAA